MAYEVHLVDSVKKKLRKMVKKDSLTYRRLIETFNQLSEDPHGVGKWMHSEYAGVRERHMGHFVVKYVIDESTKIVTIVEYDHHA
jgi:mRNA-degrading endonuclease RelE of RelBE toxin-antitoxin system